MPKRCPLCKGAREVVARPERLMGATYPEDDPYKGDEHLEPCPLCLEAGVEKETPPEIKALLEKTKVASIDQGSVLTLIVYEPDDLQPFVKAALPHLRKGGTLSFTTPSKIPGFEKVQAWLDIEEALDNYMHTISHPDGERVLMYERLEVRYPNMPHAQDSYLIRLFWKKFDTGNSV